MKAEITINSRLPGLNEYVHECRKNPYSGAQMKRISQEICEWSIKRQCKDKFIKPVRIRYTFYEKDRRRDKSNVAAFGVKVIEDALVNLQILKDDGWKYIEGYSLDFGIDKARPRIEVEISEVDGN